MGAPIALCPAVITLLVGKIKYGMAVFGREWGRKGVRENTQMQLFGSHIARVVRNKRANKLCKLEPKELVRKRQGCGHGLQGESCEEGIADEHHLEEEGELTSITSRPLANHNYLI